MQSLREEIDAAAASIRKQTQTDLAGGYGASRTTCARLNAVLDAKAEAEAAAGAAIACAAGCTFCCHLRVGVFHHEAIAVLQHLRANTTADSAAIETRIVENARRIEALDVREHYAANIPCALLIDGRCSVHPVRPSACAAYHSLSRERCECSHAHPKDIGTPKNRRPVLLKLHALGDALIAATKAGLDAAGLWSGQRELHQALRELLERSRPAAAVSVSRDPSGGEELGRP